MGQSGATHALSGMKPNSYRWMVPFWMKEKELKKKTKETKTQLKRAEEEVEECMIQRARVRRETMVLEKEKERKRREVETRTEARGACEKALAWLEWEEVKSKRSVEAWRRAVRR